MPARQMPRAAGERASGEAYAVIALGTPRKVLVDALADMSARTGVHVVGFAGLKPADPRTVDRALHRRRRAGAAPRVRRAVPGGRRRRRGGGPRARGRQARPARVTQGRTVPSPHGPRWTRAPPCAASSRSTRRAGTTSARSAWHAAANDLTMLQTVDRPIVVPLPDGRLDAVLAAALPQAERASATGGRRGGTTR